MTRPVAKTAGHKMLLRFARTGEAQSNLDGTVTLSMELIERIAKAFYETEPTDAAIEAYLRANDAYWKEVDKMPTRPGKWRNGTPSEATRVSLRAAWAAQKGEPPC